MVNLLICNNKIIDILSQPNDNGITIFVIGILFILSLYHFLLYFQQLDKAYLFYSLYTFMIFFGLLNRPKSGFIVNLIEPIKEIIDHLELNFIMSYNLVYIIFAYVLLDFKKHHNKWYRYFYWSVRFILVYGLILEILFFITGNEQIIIRGHLAFTISIYLSGLLLYIPLFTIKSPLKFYIIIGATFLVISSLIVSVIKRIDLSENQQEIRYSIFYIGLVIENIFFTLALGHKQKLIQNEKNKSQEKLILKLKENEHLKQKVQEQLEKDIKALNERAEIERLKSIEIAYDKEMAELKVSALRSQMNPHFIFNSLNSIKRYIIDNEKENAVFYLNKFSKLIRKILASTEKREFTLEEELETLKLYVNIENLRFNDTIDFRLDYDTSLNLSSIKIPSLITQPFIENAIWHGLSLNKEKKRELKVLITKEEDSLLYIDIIDNGIGRQKSLELKEKKLHKRESLGIKLSEERLIHFSKNYNMNGYIMFTDLFENGMASGTKVTIALPFE